MTRLTVRSKVLKIRNLPKGQRRVGTINSKPLALFIVLLVLGVLLVAVKKNLFIGIFLIVFSLYNILFIRGDCLVEFYEDFVVFYHIHSNKDECYLLFWEDIAKWQIVRNRKDYDELCIELKNHMTVKIPCVSKLKLERYFKRYAQTEAQEDVVTSKSM